MLYLFTAWGYREHSSCNKNRTLEGHVYFHSKVHVNFFTLQSERVTQVFLTYPMCGNLHWQHFEEQILISASWLWQNYKSWKIWILECLCLISKIEKNIILWALSTCQSLWNVKVSIILGGAIICQGAVMENFVSSHFYWSLSFFSVLHLVLVIGFPWLSLEGVCIWPKFSIGSQFHICYRVVQSLLFWHLNDTNPGF